MNITFKEKYTGNEIVKALSSIPGYKTKIITQTEVFDEKLGIIPGKVKIKLTSLSPVFSIRKDIEYPIIITVGSVFLTCKYYVINMKVNYIEKDGTVFTVSILTDNEGNKTNLTKNIEAVIRQFLKNLDRKLVTNDKVDDFALKI